MPYNVGGKIVKISIVSSNYHLARLFKGLTLFNSKIKIQSFGPLEGQNTDKSVLFLFLVLFVSFGFGFCRHCSGTEC